MPSGRNETKEALVGKTRRLSTSPSMLVIKLTSVVANSVTTQQDLRLTMMLNMTSHYLILSVIEGL